MEIKDPLEQPALMDSMETKGPSEMMVLMVAMDMMACLDLMDKMDLK